MNPQEPIPPREEIEAKLTALLLGELPADEAFALGRMIEQDAELAKTLERLKQTIKLVRETEAPIPGQASQAAPLKLSEKRREALLQRFKTVKPKEFEKQRRSRVRILEVAAVVAIVGLLAAMMLPALSKAKSKARRIAAIAESRKHGTSEREDLDGAPMELPAASSAAQPHARSNAFVSGYPFTVSGSSNLSVPGIVDSSRPGGVALFDDANAADRDGQKGLSGVKLVASFQAKSNGAGEAANGTNSLFYGLTPTVPTEQSARGEVAISFSANGVSAANQPRPQTPPVQIVLPASNEVAQQVDSFALADGITSKTASFGNAGWIGAERSKQGQTRTDSTLADGTQEQFTRKQLQSQLSNSVDLGAGAMALDDLAKLDFKPRVPVEFNITPTTPAAQDSSRFRFYADMNRNGRFDPNGMTNPSSGPVVAGNPIVTVDPATGVPMAAPEPVTASPPAPLVTRTHDLDGEVLRRRAEELGINGTSEGGLIAGQGGGTGVGVGRVSQITNSFGSFALNKEIPAKTPEVAAAAGPMPAQREINGDVLALDQAGKIEPIGIPERSVRQPGRAAAEKSKASSTPPASSVVLPPSDSVVTEMSRESQTNTTNVRDAQVLFELGRNDEVQNRRIATSTQELAKAEDLYGDRGPTYKKDTVYRERLERLPTAGDMPRGATVLKEGAAGEKQYAKVPTTISPSNVYDLKIVGYANVRANGTNPFSTNLGALVTDLPGLSTVAIVDEARPATTASSSLWDKLTGKPAHYESKARVKVDRDLSDVTDSDSKLSDGVYDPYFIQTEFETIQSTQVLGKVVKDLRLDEKWAKDGRKVSTNEAIAKLKGMLDVKPVEKTSYIDIHVKDQKAGEAADIANSVARAYGDFRTEQRKQVTLGGIVALKEQMTEEEKKVAEQQKIVDEQRLKLQVPDSVASADAPATLAKNDVASKVEAKASEDRPLPKPVVPLPTPQPEVQATDNPFSTFSLNVSDVSFKLAQASLEKGTLPEAAGIRSEEFINAFDYRDPEPPANVPVAFAWERAQYPFAQNRDVLRFSIKTAAQGRESGKPLNLVLLVDNSGSMERADRVRILRESLRVLGTQLQAQDKLSIVSFARTPHLRVDAIPGNQAGQAIDQVTGLTPEGGTNLEEGMNLAYQTALRHYLTNGVNRVVLMTDGAANLGDVVPESLKGKVEGYRKQGVALDCFGIGWEGYNDDLLEMLSRNGDGRYGFINSPEEAASEFAGQLAGALHVAASDVKVQVEFNPKRVTAYRQIGYAKHQLTKEQFRDNTVDAAEIGAAEAGNALYVIQANPSGEGPVATVRVRYKVPGTSDYREQEWVVPYTGGAVLLEQANPAMRLAATASAFSEWLATSPYAGEVTPDGLLRYLSGVPQVYGADGRPKKLEWMIREAKTLSGK